MVHSNSCKFNNIATIVSLIYSTLCSYHVQEKVVASLTLVNNCTVDSICLFPLYHTISGELWTLM